jgi:Cu(I)/Ag(I) efflux system membrane fusion protein
LRFRPETASAVSTKSQNVGIASGEENVRTPQPAQTAPHSEHKAMTPAKEKTQILPPAKVPTGTQAFGEQLAAVVQAYFALQEALAADQPAESAKLAAKARQTLNQVDMGLLTGQTHMLWMAHLKALDSGLAKLAGYDNLKQQREAFSLVSAQLTRTVQAFPVADTKIYQAFCPMAFGNQGAFWLQNGKQIVNPYFGAMMLRCGEIRQEITPPAAD